METIKSMLETVKGFAMKPVNMLKNLGRPTLTKCGIGAALIFASAAAVAVFTKKDAEGEEVAEAEVISENQTEE